MKISGSLEQGISWIKENTKVRGHPSFLPKMLKNSEGCMMDALSCIDVHYTKTEIKKDH